MELFKEISNPHYLAQLAASLFFAILFLQSGFDKVLDWKGNIDWLQGHFEKTIFKGYVKPMVATLTIMELAAGITSGAGAIIIAIDGRTTVSILGLSFASLAFLSLFFGQRISKDYVGAANLAIYFGVALVSLFLFA